MSKSVKELLDDTIGKRGVTHGDYTKHAKCLEDMIEICRNQPNWKTLCPEYKEGIYMIVFKLARILVGQMYHKDHVFDIIGYATLMQVFADNEELKLIHINRPQQFAIHNPLDNSDL